MIEENLCEVTKKTQIPPTSMYKILRKALPQYRVSIQDMPQITEIFERKAYQVAEIAVSLAEEEGKKTVTKDHMIQAIKEYKW